MKHIATLILAFALGIGTANAQQQTFNLPAYFATNVFLSDNTNTPLHSRITAIEQTNTDAWATFPATTNLNFAEFGATNINHLEFDQSPTGDVGVARMQWNADTETLRMGLDANVTLDIGQQQAALVRNAESVTISNGMVVYISGATGDKATIKIASYSNDTLSARTIGIAAENITAGSTGYVITRGPIFNQNTSAFTAGDMLYLGAYGNFTTNRPAAPLHGVFVGVVEKVNANAGVIYVAVQNGFELDELHDVNVTANTTNHLIISQGAVWTNMAIGSGLAVSNNQLVVTNVAGFSVASSDINMASYDITNITQIGYFEGNTNYIDFETSEISGSYTFMDNLNSPLKVGTGSGVDYSSIYLWDTINQTNNIRLRNEDGDLIVTLPYGTSGLSVENGKFIGSAAGLTNFPSSLLTVSAGNTNYLRRTTVPPSNTAFGAYNQFALDNTNLYIYNATSSKWLRISGTLEW